MNNQITSLCYVSKRDERTTQVCRIADYENGRFVPYDLDPDAEFYGTERDILYFPNQIDATEIGAIGVYDWYVDRNNGRDWTQVTRSSKDWIEVVLTDLDSPEMIVQAFLHGWNCTQNYHNQHDLIVCCHGDGDRRLAIYLSKGDLVSSQEGFTFSSKVVRVRTGVINLTMDTGACISRYSQRDQRRYLSDPNAFLPLEEILVRSDMDIVGTIVKEDIRKLAQSALSRREKQLVGAAMEKLDMQSLEESVRVKLQCKPEYAAELIDRFIQNTKMRLEDRNTTLVLETLVQNDTQLVAKLREDVLKTWQRDNEQAVRDARAKLSETEDQIQKKEYALKEAQDRYQAAMDKLTEAEKALADQEKLSAELEEKIQSQLQRMPDPRAALFLDHPLANMPQLGSVLSATAQETFRIRQVKPVDAPTTGDIAVGWDAGIRLFQGLVGSGDLARQFVLLAFAAYIHHQEMLFVGNTASVFADTMAQCLTGALPVHVRLLSDSADPVVLCEKLRSTGCKVFVLDDALSTGYDIARNIHAELSDALIMYTVRHEEMMALEPLSLFTTCFPVFTDEVALTDRVPAVPCPDCTAALESFQGTAASKEIKAMQDRLNTWLGDGFWPPILKNKCENLMKTMQALSKLQMKRPELGVKSMEMQVMVPLLRSLAQSEKILPVMDRLSDYTKAEKENLSIFMHHEGIVV